MTSSARPPRSRPVRRLGKSVLRSLGAGPRRVLWGAGRGLRMQFDFDEHAMHYLGLYEIELDRDIRRLCNPRLTAYDVGASFGYDTLILARRCAAVIAFEPDPEACDRLRVNAGLNPSIQARIDLRPTAVGRGDDSAPSIDQVVAAGSPPPGLLKIDVEGSEVDVLEGAATTLRTHRPAVLLEVHSAASEDACATILRDAAYAVRVVPRRRWLAEKRPMPHNRWLVATP
jgi:hypothetical protein